MMSPLVRHEIRDGSMLGITRAYSSLSGDFCPFHQDCHRRHQWDAFRDQEANMDTKRRLLIAIVAVTVILATIGITAMIVSIKLRSMQSCRLIGRAPEPDFANLSNIVSEDSRVIANFQGYLSLPQDHLKPSDVLPLRLEAVRYWRTRTGVEIVLVADCAEVNLKYDLTSSRYSKSEIREITVGVKNHATGHIDYCQIEYPGIVVEYMKHYACVRPRRYTCLSQTGRFVAFLVTTALEFEVYGDIKTLLDGDFSTPPDYCA